LEELLTKDNENISLLADVPLRPSEPQGFAPDQMVRCDECLRANPPTRVECLYCGHTLPLTEASAALIKPTLRTPEKWEQGYTTILLKPPANLSDEAVQQVAGIVRLEVDDLRRVLLTESAVPLARTAAEAEAGILEQSLVALGLEVETVSDVDLRIEAAPPRRLRTLELRSGDFIAFQTTGSEGMVIPWEAVTLIATARLVSRQVELKERKRRGSLKEIVNASESMSDEEVVDIYADGHEGAWRIMSNSFDFTCLAERKTLLSSQNFATLINAICERAPAVVYDNSYNGLRRTLELVWPSEPQTASGGWHRDRAGKYSTSEVTMSTNEPQFTRYSRLRHFLKSAGA
jgi:hypothetical protein